MNILQKLEKIQLESVIKISGKVVERTKETINLELKTGEIEVVINSLKFLEAAKNFLCQCSLIKSIQKK